jgi:PPP family 3-phenylpropionic acid transporter
LHFAKKQVFKGKIMDKRANVKLNTHYAVINGLFWGSFAALWGSLSVVLLAYGFKNTQIGIISATALVLAMVFQPILSARCDRSTMLTDRRVMLLLGLAALAACLVLDLTAGSSRLGMAVLFVLLGMLLTLSPPFHNSLAMELVASGRDLNYGLGRGVGSACYALTILLTGKAIGVLGPRFPMRGFLLLTFLFLIGVYFFRYITVPTGVERARAPKIGMLAFLRQYPLYARTLLACTLLMASHSATTVYMFQIVGKVGAQSGAMGVALGIGAMLELPAMALFSLVRKRFGLSRVFCFSGLMFVLRVTLLLSATSIQMVYLAMLTQFFEYGFFQPSTVYYAAKTIPAAHRNRGQALIHVFPSGLGSAMGNFFCGWLLDLFGVNGMLLFPLACAVSGTVILWTVMRKERNRINA